ncbi:MAG: hypothetical protein WCW87_02465 [Candidatus Paceibacterota bacterium]
MEQNNKKSLMTNILTMCSIGYMVFLLFFVASALNSKDGGIPIMANVKVEKNNNAFNNLNIEAKSVIVYDINSNKILYGKNENERMPLASLTKIMTAVTALKLAPKDLEVPIMSSFIIDNNGLKANDKWKLGTLLSYTLIVSSNDGARSVASVIGAKALGGSYENGNKWFVDQMNKQARAIGDSDVYFYNETGLDIDKTTNGGMGSALGVVKMFVYAFKQYPEIFEITNKSSISLNSISGARFDAKNTDKIASLIPGLLASKTGLEDTAGGNLAVIFDSGLNKPIAIVVLGSTAEGRFKDVLTLASSTLSYLKQ